MNFSLICLLSVITTVPFGTAFLLAPESTAGQYGISGWNPGSVLLARSFGIALLYVGGAALAVRNTADTGVQQRIATWFALTSTIAVAASLHAVLTGAVNAMGWTSVAIYAFFTLAWASFVLGKTR